MQNSRIGICFSYGPTRYGYRGWAIFGAGLRPLRIGSGDFNT